MAILAVVFCKTLNGEVDQRLCYETWTLLLENGKKNYTDKFMSGKKLHHDLVYVPLLKL